MPFFSSSCFTGYDDSSKVSAKSTVQRTLHSTVLSLIVQGFYAVYKGIFRRVADEEIDEEGTPLPGFGKH